MKSPSSPKELDLSNGVVFEQGTFEGTIINKLVVFPLVMHLDAAESTHQAKAALEGLLKWGKEEFGLNYSSTLIRRWAYVSDVTFETDFPLLRGINRVLDSISGKLSKTVAGNLKEHLTFEPAKIVLAHDPNTRSASIASFTIEHRALSLFEENIYYSEAPIPTDEHILLLSELEEAIRQDFEG